MPGEAAQKPTADRRLEQWLRTKLGLISQKGKLAEAINYALSRWGGLTRFLDDGRIELDNKTVERSIRPITLNRKNALFAGSDGGADHWATIATLIETCKLNDIDPLSYLTDVLAKDRQRSSQSQYRRAVAVGLPKARPQSCGLRTSLTVHGLRRNVNHETSVWHQHKRTRRNAIDTSFITASPGAPRTSTRAPRSSTVTVAVSGDPEGSAAASGAESDTKGKNDSVSVETGSTS